MPSIGLRALCPHASTALAFRGDAKSTRTARVDIRPRPKTSRLCTVTSCVAMTRIGASAVTRETPRRCTVFTRLRRAFVPQKCAVTEPNVTTVDTATETKSSTQQDDSRSNAKSFSKPALKPKPDPLPVAFERGVPFQPDGAFYRSESVQARDLAILLACTLDDAPRVLDAMAGTGVRSARYLAQANAQHVHLNDASAEAQDALLATLDALFSPPIAETVEQEEVIEDEESSSAESSAAASNPELDEESSDAEEDAVFPDPNEADDFATAIALVPNPSAKPHPFKKTKRGRKKISREAKMAEMAEKMQKTKLFKLTKVTKKERKRLEMEGVAVEEEEEVEDEDSSAAESSAAASKAQKKKAREQRKKEKKGGEFMPSMEAQALMAGAETEPEPEAPATEVSFEASDSEPTQGPEASPQPQPKLGTISLTSKDARRLMSSMYGSHQDRFDIVDIDSFGSDTFFDDALRVTKLGGYVYLTSTDALALCGKNPGKLMCNYGGAFVSPNVPAVNETALRVFIGDAVRRGAQQGLDVTPVFSLFHPHGPVFRAMLKIEKQVGAWETDNKIGMLGQCETCGDTRVVGASEMGACHCVECANHGLMKNPMAVSGPLWTGSLHDRSVIQKLKEQAEGKGWDESESSQPIEKGQMSLSDLLSAFEAESDEQLPPFYRRTDELGRAGRGLTNGIPPLDQWIVELQIAGFVACRSHVDPRGLKSNAPLEEVIAAGNKVSSK